MFRLRKEIRDLGDIVKDNSPVRWLGLPYLINPLLSTAFGLVVGEMFDRLPYLDNIIPEGIAYIGNAFTEQDTVKKTTDYLYGNIDKIGAASGFIGSFFR